MPVRFLRNLVEYPEAAGGNEELKQALETERQITLRRLEVAKYWSFTLVHNIIKLSKAVFEKMDDLIVYAVRDENQIIKESVSPSDFLSRLDQGAEGNDREGPVWRAGHGAAAVHDAVLRQLVHRAAS